jgi:nitrite reductase/ring-hydroxylating ferredoxin subunit
MAGGREPLWRDEFSIDMAEDRYVTRRQFGKFLVLTSLGMLVGNAVIFARSLFRKTPVYEPQVIARAFDLAAGQVRQFHYPGPKDPCLLIRTPEGFVAYSQKCTHLSCAVYYEHATSRLVCPCHHGYFSAQDGSVLQGPPPRRLPRVLLEEQGGEIVAIGIDAGPDDHGGASHD